MSAFITLDDIHIATPDGFTLAGGLTLAFGHERTGLVGRNGSGKSTLLSVLAGQCEPASGTVRRRGRTGLLRQSPEDRLTIAEALGMADALDRLARMEAGCGDLDDAAEADWTLPGRLERALADAGLVGVAPDRRLDSLSGGEAARVAIARARLERPDLLLLDEPTNNLDADGRAIVADLVAGWPGGVVVASHDRDLLERMDRIVGLSPVGVTVVGGGWSAYVQARDAARERAEAEVVRAEDALAAAGRAIRVQREKAAGRDRMGRAKRASGSQAKLLLDAAKNRAETTEQRDAELASRRIDHARARLDAARADLEILTPLTIAMPPSGLPNGRGLVVLDQVRVERSGHRILGPIDLRLRGPERVAVTGRNGAGKSTLLAVVAGEMEPTGGRAETAHGRIARLDQHARTLDDDETLLEGLCRLNPDLTANAARAALARFAFRNRAADKRVATLSGGERLRAGLAVTVSRREPPWLLVLDEPTNHLDVDSVEVLEEALKDFDGALLIASHDARFLEAVGITRRVDLA